MKVAFDFIIKPDFTCIKKIKPGFIFQRKDDKQYNHYT